MDQLEKVKAQRLRLSLELAETRMALRKLYNVALYKTDFSDFLKDHVTKLLDIKGRK